MKLFHMKNSNRALWYQSVLAFQAPKNVTGAYDLNVVVTGAYVFIINVITGACN